MTDPATKVCLGCRAEKPEEEFYLRRDNNRPEKGRFRVSRCKVCERERGAAHQRKIKQEAGDLSAYERRVIWHGRAQADKVEARIQERGREKGRRVERKRVAALAPKPPKPPLPERMCPRCVKPFTPSVPQQIYCTRACSWRQQRSRRRARLREAFVEDVSLVDIYDRDGGVCQLCHEPVDRRCKYPHPRTPVLDHIVPLSRGGLHEAKNLQLAHHGCNDRKQTRALGSQLRLLG